MTKFNPIQLKINGKVVGYEPDTFMYDTSKVANSYKKDSTGVIRTTTSNADLIPQVKFSLQATSDLIELYEEFEKQGQTKEGNLIQFDDAGGLIKNANEMSIEKTSEITMSKDGVFEVVFKGGEVI